MKRTLVGLEMMERGIARDDYKVLELRQRNRIRHQRFACAVSEEKYRAGIRSTENSALGTK